MVLFCRTEKNIENACDLFGLSHVKYIYIHVAGFSSRDWILVALPELSAITGLLQGWRYTSIENAILVLLEIVLVVTGHCGGNSDVLAK